MENTPDTFKALITSKYPNGVSSDGRKYSDIPAPELTQKLVDKFPDGVTSGGVKYTDFLNKPSTLEKVGSFLAPTVTQTIKKIGSGQMPSGRDIAGSALEIGSYALPVGAVARGASLASKGLGLASKSLRAKALETGAVGATSGAMAGAGREVGAGGTASDIAGATIAGGVLGGTVGGVLPVLGRGISTGAKATGIVKTKPEELVAKLDTNIKDIYSGTTNDVQSIRDSASKVKNALSRLGKQKIEIPDINAPLGAKTIKPLDLSKATPNEWLSGVKEMSNKIAKVGKNSVEKAKSKGIIADTTSAQNIVSNAIKNKQVGKASGESILKEIQLLENDPVKVHDWVEGVNSKYGKKYAQGTIEDNKTSKLANDIATELRTNLNKIVDRKGYAQAYGDNQELKKALLIIAKKANKGVTFGDISTDAGIDAGIALLTGNPAYMARTLGTGMFRGLFSNARNLSGFRSLKKAAELTGKVPSNIKMPSSRVKNQPLNTNQPVMPQSTTPISKTGKITDIKQSMPKVVQKSVSESIDNTIPQPATKSKLPAKPASLNTKSPLHTEARKYKTAEDFVKAQPKVYHGSGVELKQFDNKQGTFFTDDYMNAEGYASGENVYEGVLNLKNPLVIDAKGKLHRQLDTPYGKTTREIVANVDSKKYDGVIFKNIKDSWVDDADVDTPSTIYYAFKPKNAFLNESQLTDIWKEARKKLPAKPVSLKRK